MDLIPWDYDSSEHVERMHLQRLGCGWRSEEVHEKWTGLGREGRKTMYWVVSIYLHSATHGFFQDGMHPLTPDTCLYCRSSGTTCQTRRRYYRSTLPPTPR